MDKPANNTYTKLKQSMIFQMISSVRRMAGQIDVISPIKASFCLCPRAQRVCEADDPNYVCGNDCWERSVLRFGQGED